MFGWHEGCGSCIGCPECPLHALTCTAHPLRTPRSTTLLSSSSCNTLPDQKLALILQPRTLSTILCLPPPSPQISASYASAPPLCPPPLSTPRRYVRYVEKAIGVHMKWIGVGPGRDAIVLKPLEEALLKAGAR